MRKILLFLFVLVCSICYSFAQENVTKPQTPIQGEISGFLTADKSPYLVEATLTIPQGKALILDAGVTLLFTPGSGIDVAGGSFAIAGQEGNPVILKSATDARWNGISITGEMSADLQDFQIDNAEIGLAIENGAANIRNVSIDNSSENAIFTKNAAISIENARLTNSKGVGLRISTGTDIDVLQASFEKNRIGVVAEGNADIALRETSLKDNEIGVLDLGAKLNMVKSDIKKNKIGFVSENIPTDDIKNSVTQNQENFSSNAENLKNTLADAPENPNAKQFSYSIYSGFDNTKKEKWNLSGNVALQVGYHLVRTRKNHTGDIWVSLKDSVLQNERYENYFQIPGLFGNLGAYLKMESFDGKTIEFTADLESNSWNRFTAHTVRTTYTDKYQQLTLGDTYASAGDIYLAGINMLGASYSLNILQNKNHDPLFTVSAFAGELQAPRHPGDKNPDVYKEWIEANEAEAQEMVVGTSLRWKPLRRFDATIGYIGRKDYLEDPFLRDGISEKTNTIDPLITAQTFYADGNWLFYPGDIELNGQIAFGAADTSDVFAQRAIQQVFSEAGLSVSDFKLLRSLMRNPTLISSLDREELLEIFGENTLMAPSEMREKLRLLIQEAKKVLAKTEKTEDSPSDISDWDGQNLALAASLRWDLGKTLIEGRFSYVGESFYSAGSPDQLGNTRAFSARLEQEVSSFYDFALNYDLQIENASNGNKYNIFGFGEGTRWGLFPDKNATWFDEHELDENRTYYKHNAGIDNNFYIGKIAELSLGYSVDYRTRNKPLRLYANYSTESGVYNDPWFKPQKDEPTLSLTTENDTLEIDSTRFAEYYAMSDYPYLASRFEERLLKHSVAAEIAFLFPSNILKIGGIWNIYQDISHFEKDSLLDNLDLKNSTFSSLGYYFHGADYFEQRYPVSLHTSFKYFRNIFSVTPRYKMYNFASMRELEWTISERFEIPMFDNFMELFVDANYRLEYYKRDYEGDRLREVEADIDGAMTLRVHHNQALYSDWMFGATYNYRPDNRADEYRDFLLAASINYAF